MAPKGTLFIIGGHEDKGFTGETPEILENETHPNHFEILGSLISVAPRGHQIIEIIAAASSIPEEMEEMYINAYKNAGFDKVNAMRIDTEADARKDELVQRINNAHAVFFTGGDQKRLLSLVGNTPLLDAVKNRYYTDKDFIVAGTSAGAMSIPAAMLSRGIIEEAILKTDIEMSTGMGLIDGLIVDTHFIKRGRFGRLAYAVALHATTHTGLGIGEDTALIITNGNEARCQGSGMVIVIDGSSMGATNIAEADEHTPIAMENLKVHILTDGCAYMIKEKKFMLNH